MWNPFAPSLDSAIATLTKTLKQLEEVQSNSYEELDAIQSREAELLKINERAGRIAIKLRDLVN